MKMTAEAWQQQHPTGVPLEWRSQPGYLKVGLDALGVYRWQITIGMLVGGGFWAFNASHPWPLTKWSLLSSSALFLVDLVNHNRQEELREFVTQVKATADAYHGGLGATRYGSSQDIETTYKFLSTKSGGVYDLELLFTYAPERIAELIEISATDKSQIKAWNSWFASQEENQTTARMRQAAARQADQDLLAIFNGNSSVGGRYSTLRQIERGNLKIVPTLNNNANTAQFKPAPRSKTVVEFHPYKGALNIRPRLETFSNALGNMLEDNTLAPDPVEKKLRDWSVLATLVCPLFFWGIS